VNDLPRIAVMPTRETRGLHSLADTAGVVLLETFPFIEAFEQHYPSDAHFVTYCPISLEARDQGFPRLTKGVLPQLRGQGEDALTTCIALDYDTPGHAPWADGGVVEFLGRLAELEATWPTAMAWTLFYSTRGGARLIYVLDEPLPADIAEGKIEGLRQDFLKRGIEFDKGCSDWTRIFRLPYVVRDGKETTCEFIAQYENRLSAGAAPSAEKVRTAPITLPASLPGRPSIEDAKDLIEGYHATNGAHFWTDWRKRAKVRLGGRECFPFLFEQADLPEGARNDTLTAFVGQVVGLLHGVESTTPGHVYGLFLGPVEQLDPDEGHPAWPDVLWTLVARFWQAEETKEAEKAATEALAAQNASQRAASTAERLLEGIQAWCPSPVVAASTWLKDGVVQQESLDEAVAFIRRHAIVSLGHNFVILSPNGTYEGMQIASHQVIPRLRVTGMDALIPTQVPGQDGGMSDIDLTTLLNNFSTQVATVEARPQVEGSIIENIDRPNAVLVVPAYRRNPHLKPAFDNDVDNWLRRLFGDNFTKAVEWIQWSLAFDEGPICALSIEGSAGVGKKLFVQGLAECLETPRVADATDLVGRYSYGLLESPFLVVNEGWPRTNDGMHPADRFRQLSGGDPVRVERRYFHPVHVRNPVRFLFTANNQDVIRVLTANRDLSPQDRDALAIRLLHFDVGAGAEVWLRAKGGMSFTGASGRRWIAGDSGQPSDFILARHFLHLYAHRAKKPPGNRLLVEGGNCPQVLFEMRTGSGAAPLVIEALLALIEKKPLSAGITFEGGKLWVLSSEVLKYYRENLYKATRRELTASNITSAFKGLMTEGPQMRVLDTRKGEGMKRWYSLDVEAILIVARQMGWSCKTLEKISMDRALDQARKEGAACG
jgi:hypothetical protein